MADTQSESKESSKIAALTEEVHSLRAKLKDLQRSEHELQEQLVPIERVKSQMRKEKKLKEEAEYQIQVLEIEKQKLNDEVSRLVKDLVFQKGETLKYENRSLDLEKLCAQLGQSERGAQGELLRAQEREQLSRVDAFNSGLAKSRAEEERDEALARAHSKDQQLKALKAEWEVLSSHDAKLQEDVVEKRVTVNALTKDQVLLRKKHVELQESFDAQEAAFQQATCEVQALRERCEMLEADLKSWKGARPPDTIGEDRPVDQVPPQKTSASDLALAMVKFEPVQHGERHFRSAMDDRDLPSLANYLQREIRCLKSRRDYPRCAAGKQMRGRILDSAHHGPLFSDAT